MESDTTIWLIESPVVMVLPLCHSEAEIKIFTRRGIKKAEESHGAVFYKIVFCSPSKNTNR